MQFSSAIVEFYLYILCWACEYSNMNISDKKSVLSLLYSGDD